jgi:hypothetical protein
MPDWKKIVRERMASLALPQEREQSIVAELATYLEDDYIDGLAHGLDETAATERAVAQIQWKKLSRRIRNVRLKEEPMNNRTKSLWLPAIANLTVATVLLIVLDKLGAEPRMIRAIHLALARLALSHPGAFRSIAAIEQLVDVFHLPWLFTLPFSAAAASLLARRAQAPTAIRLIAGLAPSLVWLAVFVVMPLVFLLDRWQFPAGFPLGLNYFASSAIAWIMVPAVPLLLGTLPFLRQAEARGV